LKTVDSPPLEQTADAPDPQQLSYDRAIACLSSRLLRYRQVPVELKAQIEPQLEILSSLQQKLSQPLIQIAVFGLVSRGKSAVLNGLFGEPIFPTGPLNGVTQWPRSVRWSPAPDAEKAPSIQLELIDTPGLDEISGESRAAMAQDIAACADLILFVTAGPPIPFEQKALGELAELAKPLLWVVNKADLYPDLNAEALYQSIDSPALQSMLSPREIVLAAAAPAPIQVRHEWPDGRVSLDWESPPPQVKALQQSITDLLHREGLYLLSLNVLLQAQAAERQIVQTIAAFYADATQSARGQLWSLKAVLIGLSPWVWPDLLLNFGFDIVQVRQLIHRYGLGATGYHVEALWKTLAVSMGLMGAAELGTTGLGWVFDGIQGGLPGGVLPGMALQGAIAAYGASRVERSAQRYLLDGATWDAQGPSTLIQHLLGEIPSDAIVSRLSGAIARSLS
jgi:uncharacterized protein